RSGAAASPTRTTTPRTWSAPAPPSTSSAATPGWTAPRSRPSASRATTASPWRAWWPERGPAGRADADGPRGRPARLSHLVVEAHVDAARGGAVLDDDLAAAAPGQGDGAAVGDGLGVLPDGQPDVGGRLRRGAAQPAQVPAAVRPAPELQVHPGDEQPVVRRRQPAHRLVAAHPQHGARLARRVGHEHPGRGTLFGRG